VLVATVAGTACSQTEETSPIDTGWIAKAVRARYGDGVGEIRYFHGSADLDEDGDAEVLVHVVGPMLCGTGGCNTLVLTPGDSGYDVVTDISLTRPPIRVSSRSSRGWKNLLVAVSGGGILPGHDAELRFDGSSYPSNPTVPPAEPETDTTGALVVIPEFGSFTQGTLVPPGETAPTADVSAAPLGRWEWVAFQGMDDSTLEVDDPSRYTLEIREDGVSVIADCNRGRGGLTLNGPSISFGELAMTRMACGPQSLEDRYLSYLEYVRSWVMEGGDLYLSLMADGGIMQFRPVPDDT
jgi:heat shock protein HslJ